MAHTLYRKRAVKRAVATCIDPRLGMLLDARAYTRSCTRSASSACLCTHHDEHEHHNTHTCSLHAVMTFVHPFLGVLTAIAPKLGDASTTGYTQTAMAIWGT